MRPKVKYRIVYSTYRIYTLLIALSDAVCRRHVRHINTHTLHKYAAHPHLGTHICALQSSAFIQRFPLQYVSSVLFTPPTRRVGIFQVYGAELFRCTHSNMVTGYVVVVIMYVMYVRTESMPGGMSPKYCLLQNSNIS